MAGVTPRELAEEIAAAALAANPTPAGTADLPAFPLMALIPIWPA
jgi:hypothetical protein